jgi:hypothetical protein
MQVFMNLISYDRHIKVIMLGYTYSTPVFCATTSQGHESIRHVTLPHECLYDAACRV